MSIPRKLTQNFVETDVDDEVLLVDLDGGELFSLAGSARAVWRLIDGVRDIATIAAELAGEFDGCGDVIRADCDALIAELVAAKLVAVAD